MQTGKQAFNVSNTIILPEWTRFDLGARYVVAVGDAPITFRVNVDNVANNNYWSSSLGGYLVQGLPRTFKRSEEHTSELQSLMRISYAVFCLIKKKNKKQLQK